MTEITGADFAERAKSTSTELTDLSRASEEPLYNDTCFAYTANSSCFQNTTLLVITANAIWIFVDVEWNHASLKRSDGTTPLEPASIVVENVFCVFFFLELVVRFLAFRRKCRCWRDPWFDFDAVLLVFMVLENWILPVVDAFSAEERSSGDGVANFAAFRLLRLLRLTRLVKLMRFFPELMTLVKGMVRAMESVLFVLLFLVILTYGTSIIFTSTFGKPPDQRSEEDEDSAAREIFGNIFSSMMSLFTHGVLGDNLFETITIIRDENVLLLWVFFAFMVVSGITLLNMLIGVLCKVIEQTASEELEKRKAFELREALCKAFKAVDISNDGYIQEQEWAGIQNNPEVTAALLRLGVDESEVDLRLQQMRAHVFGERTRRPRESKRSSVHSLPSTTSRREPRQSAYSSYESAGEPPELDFEDFIDKVSDLDWDKPASALDVETFRAKFRKETEYTQKKLDGVERLLQEVLEQRGAAAASGASLPLLSGGGEAATRGEPALPMSALEGNNSEALGQRGAAAAGEASLPLRFGDDEAAAREEPALPMSAVEGGNSEAPVPVPPAPVSPTAQRPCTPLTSAPQLPLAFRTASFNSLQAPAEAAPIVGIAGGLPPLTSEQLREVPTARLLEVMKLRMKRGRRPMSPAG
uniref:Ion transport domain-containing protein n=1 Tax=Pyrodinium bahamense TaxID=73915 RepID=A0A7S0BC97_9DINO|mmetsp:Transcript_8949/g.24857  ORF Transcript_8949/g.24857 Transcript_8949/m.24857 type:complete len:643 (+) Transcript_8949:102-2030(+)